MGNIKPMGKISKKWNDRVGVSSSDYIDGIKNPKLDWEEEASSEQAEANYASGINNAINRKTRVAGVKKAGTQKWQNGAIKKQGRWSEGVAGAVDQYEEGFSPYHNEIDKVDYGVRYPSGDPRNLQRVKVGNEALHNLKLKLTGGA